MTATVLHLPPSRRHLPSAARPAVEATIVQLATYRDVAEGRGWDVRADAVIDAVEELLGSGGGDEVVEFCERAIRLLQDNAAAIHDDAAVCRLAARLGAVHARARRRVAR